MGDILGVVCMILCLTVLIKHLLLTNRQMDRQTNTDPEQISPVAFQALKKWGILGQHKCGDKDSRCV